jgi:hypothetical protein
LKWSISDVWEYHKKHGIKPNPLYGLGMSRVGCFPCIMSRKDEIRRISIVQPSAIDNIRTMEQAIGRHRAAEESEWKGSSFFHSKGVAKAFRRKTWIRKSDGKVYHVSSIDDVVDWSKTKPGGREYLENADVVVPNLYDELPLSESVRTCPSSLGLCE